MRELLKGSFVALVSIFLAVLLFTGGNVLMFWSIFSWVQGSIHVITGLDVQLSNIFAALTLAVIVMFPFVRTLLAFTPIPQERKHVYRSLVFLGIAVFFGLTYWASRSTYFDPETGQPVKYYSQLPSGEYRFYSEPGYDPLTGDTLQEVTPEVSMRSSGLWKESNSPFDPETGEAIQYYSQLPNGEYRFYLKPGFESLTGEPLQKVTREVILKSKGLLVTPDHHFDPETGAPLKYYSELDGRYRIYSEPGYDPVTGDILKKITKEVSLKSRGLWIEPEVPAKEPPKSGTPSTTNLRSEYREKSKEELPSQANEPTDTETQFQTERNPIGKGSSQPASSPPTPKPKVYMCQAELTNKTDLPVEIYDLFGKLAATIAPRSRTKLWLATGEYYYIAGKRQENFLVKRRQTLRMTLSDSRTTNGRSW